MPLPLLTHLLQSQLTLVLFIFIQCHDIILNSNILSFTQYATDFNLALELRINKIKGEELILSVDWDCQFSLRCLRCSYICPKRRVLLVVEMVVSWFDYYKCIFTKQIRRRGSNRIFFIGSRCHAEQVIKIYRLWLRRLREVAVDR